MVIYSTRIVNQSINFHSEASGQQDPQLNANACSSGLSPPLHWGPDQAVTGHAEQH